jgi:hypothetical protein
MNMMDALLNLTNLGARSIDSPANQAAADLIRESFHFLNWKWKNNPIPAPPGKPKIKGIG